MRTGALVISLAMLFGTALAYDLPERICCEPMLQAIESNTIFYDNFVDGGCYMQYVDDPLEWCPWCGQEL